MPGQFSPGEGGREQRASARAKRLHSLLLCLLPRVLLQTIFVYVLSVVSFPGHFYVTVFLRKWKHPIVGLPGRMVVLSVEYRIYQYHL